MHPFGASKPPCHAYEFGSKEAPCTSSNSTDCVSGTMRMILSAQYGTPYIDPSGALMPPYHLFFIGDITSPPINVTSSVFVHTLNTLAALHGTAYSAPSLPNDPPCHCYFIDRGKSPIMLVCPLSTSIFNTPSPHAGKP